MAKPEVEVLKPIAKGRGTLPGPAVNEVKIWFQGATGSGKTLLSDLIKDALEAKGLKVRTYVFGSGVPMEDQFVDLTRQYVNDVLTVEVDSDGLRKLLEREEVRR